MMAERDVIVKYTIVRARSTCTYCFKESRLQRLLMCNQRDTHTDYRHLDNPLALDTSVLVASLNCSTKPLKADARFQFSRYMLS